MSVHLAKIPLVGAALLLGCSLLAQPPAEPADDPLPKGAKVRFGVTRPTLRTGPAVALLPSKYTNFLAPTMTGGVRRYDLGTGRPLDKQGVVGPGQVVVSADGKRAAVAPAGALTVVDVATKKPILAVEPPEGVVLAGVPGVSLSANGKVLAYGGRGMDRTGVVVVCDVDKNEVIAQVETAQDDPVFPTLSRDGKTLATHGPTPPAQTTGAIKPAAPPPSSGGVRTAQVWDATTGKERFKARVSGMGGMVVASAFSPDGALLAVSAADGPIDLWDVKTGKRRTTLLGRRGQGVCVAFSPDGKTVASVGPDYGIQRWNAEGKPLGATNAPVSLIAAQVSGLTFADNERVIAWATIAQFAVAWEAPTGRLLSPVTTHAAAIHSVAFPAGGEAPYTSGRDGLIFRWDWTTGYQASTVDLHPVRLPGEPLVRPIVHVAADGTRALWGRDRGLEVFDLSTGEDRFGVPAPSAPPAALGVGVSQDGKKVAMACRQGRGKATGTCVVWDLATQQRVIRLDIPPSVHASSPTVHFSPDGTRLVIAALATNPEGKTILMVAGYDLKTGKKLGEVKDETVSGQIMLAAANEKLVISSSTGRLWSVDYVGGRIEDDVEKVDAGGESPFQGKMVFSDDGKRFAIGTVGEPYTTYGVRVYDWAKRKHLHTFLGHAGPVSTLRFSPDGKYLASGAEDTSVLVWDLSKIPAR